MRTDSTLTLWSWVIGILLIGVVALVILVLSRQTGDPYGTRRVLCIGIIRNTENPARLDPTLLHDCAAAGVYP